MTTLFSSLQVGAIAVPNRIFMAPLTRCRAGEGHVPDALMAEHYAQRASAGLLIAEATMAMAGNSAFWHEPGIHSEAQVAGWKLVTDCGARRRRAHLPAGLAWRARLPSGCSTTARSRSRRAPLPITNDEVHTPAGQAAVCRAARTAR